MKIEFKGAIATHHDDWINRIVLTKIPNLGDKMDLPEDFDITENEPPIDRTLVNFARKAFFERKCLKVTIEYDERIEE